MRYSRLGAGSLLCLLFVYGASVRAESPVATTPLRLIPADADFVVEVKHPRQLIESMRSLDAVNGFLALQAVQELYDSTAARRFYQLLAYFEKELGKKWPAL